MSKNNGNKNGERMIAPEKSTFSRLFIPSGDDEPAVVARKIAVIIGVLAVLVLVVYLILSAIAPKEEEPEPVQTTATETVVITTAETTTVTEPTTVTTTVTEETTTTTTAQKELVLRDDMASTLQRYPDAVGHLKIPGTMVDTMVVQREDNDFYLDHDVNGNYYYGGSVFMDFRCVINDYDKNQSDNVVIYGHNQKDGTMFGTLQYYKVKRADTSRFEFYLEHPTFTYTSLYEEYTYKIVAMFISEADASQARDGIIFDAHNFVKFNKGKRSFANFKKNINERTAVYTGVDFNEDDKFMTLSTCSNEFEPSRFIVIGRRVRDGESPEVDTSKAKINPDAIEPDLDFIYGRG